MNDKKKKTVLFIANDTSQLSGSRGLIIDRFLDSGWSVIALASLDSAAEGLREKGVIVKDLDVSRTMFSPLSDLKVFFKISRVYWKYKPDLAHCFHIKPIVLGNLAKMLFSRKSKLVNTITGLGYAFNVEGITNKIASLAYKIALKGCDVTIFQNPDDRNQFVNNKILDEEKAEVIISSGIDPEEFNFSPETEEDEEVKVLIATRLLWQKGIKEFVEAAEIVSNEEENVKFEVAGGFEEEHADGVPKTWVEEKDEKGIIDYLGYVENMPEKLEEIDIFALPSQYREGVPRANLEAMATGKPIVTTDAPGCRETVVDGKNGTLVTPKDSEELAQAILDLARDEEKRLKMGKEGRRIIEERFDIRDITEKYFETYRKTGIDIE